MEGVNMSKPSAGDDSRYEGERPKFAFPPGSQHESVFAAKLAVMDECPYLQKTSAKGLNYTFASESGLMELLHPSMQRNGLTWGAVDVQVLATDEYLLNGGKTMFRVRLLVTYRMTHGFTATYETYKAPGEASDLGDKAFAKAMTMAQKYALRQAFLIETGDDPDTTPSQPAATKGKANADGKPKATLEQRVALAKEAIAKASTEERYATLEQNVRERFVGEVQAELLALIAAKRKPAPAVEPPPAEPTPEQREAKASDAIKTATDGDKLHKIELEVVKLTGTVFSPQQGSRLLAQVSARKRELALTHKPDVKHGPAYEKANEMLRRAAGWTQCQQARDWIIGQWQKKQLEDVEAGGLIRSSFDKEIGYAILPSQLDAIHRGVNQAVDAPMRQPLLEKLDARREAIAMRPTLDVIKQVAPQIVRKSHAEDLLKLIVSMNGQENAPLSVADAATAMSLLNPIAKRLLEEESKPAASPLMAAVVAAEAAVANV